MIKENQTALKLINSKVATVSKPIIANVCCDKDAEAGFTLIEVMVAVLILAVGILGAAGMQSVGVRESQNTYFRSQANLLVIDMANKMIANQEQSSLGEQSKYTEQAVSSVSCDFDGESCDAEAIAEMDRRRWEDAVQSSGLPNAGQAVQFVGDVQIDGVAVTAIYDIQVFWDERREGVTPDDCDNASGCVSWRVQI